MDLKGRLARAATRRVAVLLVEVPGWRRVRCALQAELRDRGWREATSPADADALVICGRPGAELSQCAELVWEQLPGPRARIRLTAPAAVSAGLDQLLAELLDTDRQRGDAVERPAEQTTTEQDQEEEQEQDDQNEGHEDMDHGGMDMPMPGGIPLADEGPDRDALDLDVLHVPLGPVLPDWPAGLVLECTLQGDLVTATRTRVLAGEAPAPADSDLEPGSPPDRLDRAARLLSVAGWTAEATDAAVLRDRLLFGTVADPVGTEIDRLITRVRRSRVLRWVLADVPGVRDQLLDCLVEARTPGAGVSGSTGAAESLGDMVVGRDLAAARLLVAAADVNRTNLGRGEAGVP